MATPPSTPPPAVHIRCHPPQCAARTTPSRTVLTTTHPPDAYTHSSSCVCVSFTRFAKKIPLGTVSFPILRCQIIVIFMIHSSHNRRVPGPTRPIPSLVEFQVRRHAIIWLQPPPPPPQGGGGGGGGGGECSPPPPPPPRQFLSTSISVPRAPTHPQQLTNCICVIALHLLLHTARVVRTGTSSVAIDPTVVVTNHITFVNNLSLLLFCSCLLADIQMQPPPDFFFFCTTTPPSWQGHPSDLLSYQ